MPCFRFRGCTLGEQLLSFHHECFDDIFAGDFAHRHAVFEDHPDAPAERDAQLRIVRFAWAIHGATHNREMKWF